MWISCSSDTTCYWWCLTRLPSSEHTSLACSLATRRRFASFLLDSSSSLPHFLCKSMITTKAKPKRLSLAAMSCSSERSDRAFRFHRCPRFPRQSRQRALYLASLKSKAGSIQSRKAKLNSSLDASSSEICISDTHPANSSF